MGRIFKKVQYQEIVDYLIGRKFKIHKIHTSGHADIKTLKQMVEAIKPRNLVPIHTFDGDDYKDIFKNVNVKRAKDKEEIEIG